MSRLEETVAGDILVEDRLANLGGLGRLASSALDRRVCVLAAMLRWEAGPSHCTAILVSSLALNQHLELKLCDLDILVVGGSDRL